MKRILGSLEFHIMELMWELEESTVPHAVSTVAKKRPRSIPSVRLVMKRLSDKGLLIRTKDEKGLRYRIGCKREQLLPEL